MNIMDSSELVHLSHRNLRNDSYYNNCHSYDSAFSTHVSY